MEIQAKLKDKPDTVFKVNYNFPEDLDGLEKKFGADVVYSKAMDSLVIDVQALVRRHMRGSEPDKDGKQKVAPKNEKEIQAIVSAWIPGVGAIRRTPVEKVGSLIAQMTEEEKKALLAQLTHKQPKAA